METIRELIPSDFKNSIAKLVIDAAKDFGKTIKNENIEFMVERLSYLIPKVHGDMQLDGLDKCFNCIAVGSIEIKGVTVRTIMDAIRQYRQIEFARLKKIQEDSPEVIFNQKSDSKYGAALVWKIKNIPHEDWDKYPLKSIVDEDIIKEEAF